MHFKQVGAIGLVIAVVVIASALRFVALETSPPGFYVDEAAISAQVLCLRDSGHDLYGQRLPLFSPVLGGGYATAPMLYSGAIWTKAFGSSIASLRGMSAFYGVLFVIGSFFFSLAIWKSREAAWLSALCVAISPWAFPMSRLAWDPALAPGLLAIAMALLFSRASVAKMSAAGLFAAFAAYSYPPLRVQLALVLPIALLLLPRVTESSWKMRAVFSMAFLAAIGPLVLLTLRGDIQGRFKVLSVFNEDYLRQFGEPTIMAGVVEFLKNLGLNFSPRYLFLTGDENLRHATRIFGQWSPLEIVAIFTLVALGLASLRRKERPSWSIAPFCFAAFGYLAGVVPAALTWESNPHALRSIGAAVFLALGAGGALAVSWRRGRAWRIAIVSLAILPTGVYLFDYFIAYPSRAEFYFDAADVEQLERRQNYPTLALRYFQQANGTITCE